MHYAARCEDETIRNEITEACIEKGKKLNWFHEIFLLISRNFSGADKFARDAFGNDSEHYVTNEFAAVVNETKGKNHWFHEMFSNFDFTKLFQVLKKLLKTKRMPHLLLKMLFKGHY